MKGDFSRWQLDTRDNFNGILPQQGKLLIDADGLAQTRIANQWQQTAARDWVGAVAAVPADEPSSFAVSAATINADGTVTLTLGSGRIWADGLLVQLGDGTAATVRRTATWLEPPIVPNPGSAAKAAGHLDVVVLEVWQEGINGYQLPNSLIEPALGGPDTAERLHTATAFRLARLAAGQTCKSLVFKDSGLGKLTATLQPAGAITGDCPIPVGGGYSGFEHRLYRIEIADVPAASPAMFKYSRENGGLVGRGIFQTAPNTLTITANLVAITTADQPSFYVEIEQWDDARGNWQVVCGANATLSGSTLTFPGAAAFGAYPAAGADVFFRLWDGLEAVAAFPIQAAPNQFENGIFLQFDAEAPGLYRPRDYWTFPVRAAGIANPQTLINAKPPEGIVYHRVPLAEITWDNTPKVQTIDDCRATITPLTAPRGCCTVQVGDGLTTFAQFTSVQAAIDSLPPEGGEVCVLAGRYFESITVNSRANVKIHGCGHHTRLASPSLGPAKGANTGAVLTVAASQDIEISSLIVEAASGDIGIHLDSTAAATASSTLAAARHALNGVANVAIANVIAVSSNQPAVSLQQARAVRIRDSVFAMENLLSKSAAVYLSGQQIDFERNWAGPVTYAILPAIVGADLAITTGAFAFESLQPASSAPCGVQIAGISRDVHVRNNVINGGSGHGVTLGGLLLQDATGKIITGYYGYYPKSGSLNNCDDGGIYYTGKVTYNNTTVDIVIDGRLTNIRIENNDIRNMGLCGVGPIAFFDLGKVQEVVTVDGLSIAGNTIVNCLRRTLVAFAKADASNLGYGGICLPDVSQVYIRDNVIQDTGVDLSNPVCGIFILHGAGVEISRNQILDTRDWSNADPAKFSGFRAGIALVMVTPMDAPSAAASGWTVKSFSSGRSDTSLYSHGAPALVLQENVVDIPIGLSLTIAGLGAFSIRGNHFSTGGMQGDLLTVARSILIFNFGTSLESPAKVSTAAEYLELFQLLNSGATLAEAQQTVLGNDDSILGVIAPGPVIFSQNRCSLHQAYRAVTAVASIMILTFDDLGFHDNQCWMASEGLGAIADAILAGGTIRVTSCRFQENIRAVYFSALTFGLANVSTMNIATNVLALLGPPATSITTPNAAP